MPRPSVKKERTEEIMLAFERCVTRYGVEGSTLERLAEESGLQRSLIRHYAGNRDDLIMALLERYLTQSQQQSQLLFAALPTEKPAQAFIEYLFDDYYSDSSSALLANALFNAAATIPELAAPLKAATDNFIEALAQLLQQTHPHCESDDRYAVASGIVGIYFNIESVAHLGDTRKWRTASKRSAHLLLTALDAIEVT